jgi:hypothetical protein
VDVSRCAARRSGLLLRAARMILRLSRPDLQTGSWAIPLSSAEKTYLPRAVTSAARSASPRSFRSPRTSLHLDVVQRVRLMSAPPSIGCSLS